MARRLDALGIGACLLLAGLFAATYAALPDTLVTHWNAANEPDGRLARPVLVAVSLALVAGTYGLFRALAWAVPDVEADDPLYLTVAGATLAFLVAVDGFLVAWNLGYRLPVGTVVPVAVGALLAVLGGAMVRFDTAASGATWPTDPTQRAHVSRTVGGSLVVAGGWCLAGLVVPEHATVLVVLGATVVPLVGLGYAVATLPANDNA
ncbi:DUF1648 domain-containing protein [Halosegnis marinus]|uniref:DUF1648 domain-containing protein n=1 Tax=Halosegnis marinus TaxID=3034023 RepID=A0ABD5ZKS5_9EURY|nr:DUF1648 domain-containing protein [Halosegnis sp. DT85]